MLAKNSGEIVLTSEGHRMERCLLHCKRKIEPVHDHAIVETKDRLVALENGKRFDATYLLQVGVSEAYPESS